MTALALESLAADLRSQAARLKGTEGLALRSAAAKADKLARALEAVQPFYTLATAEVSLVAAPVKAKAPRKASARKADLPFWKTATVKQFWGSQGAPYDSTKGLRDLERQSGFRPDVRSWDPQFQYGQVGGLKASPELAKQLASQWKFNTTDAAEAAEG